MYYADLLFSKIIFKIVFKRCPWDVGKNCYGMDIGDFTTEMGTEFLLFSPMMNLYGNSCI